MKSSPNYISVIAPRLGQTREKKRCKTAGKIIQGAAIKTFPFGMPTKSDFQMYTPEQNQRHFAQSSTIILFGQLGSSNNRTKMTAVHFLWPIQVAFRKNTGLRPALPGGPLNTRMFCFRLLINYFDRCQSIQSFLVFLH